jgi:hypothetical protein
MRYRVLKKFGNVEVGTELESCAARGYIPYQIGPLSEAFINPHEIALMINAKMLEEVRGDYFDKVIEGWNRRATVDSETYLMKIAPTKIDKILKILGE